MLQNYSYAKTGNTEASVGVGLLKLLTLNWDKLNGNQKNWCKEYLPFLLQNYRDYGANAIAANTRNQTLYDFMARSVNGAQCTYKSKVSGTTMQQEFFNYVVDSGYGFGQFVQNIIGGGKYTGAYSNSYDITLYETVGDLYFGSNNSNIDYYTASANGGDKDTDWFVHSMYLYSKGQGYSQFGTVYSLTSNNSVALGWYNKWLARFRGISETSENWTYINNQTSGLNGPAIYDAENGAYGNDHIYRGGNTYNAISRSQALLNQTASLKSGYIKPNVSSINVSLPGDSSATVSLRTAKGKELKSVTVSSGTKNIIIDCSDISKDDLTNCYLTVSYTKIVEKVSVGGTGWYDYPPYPSFEMEGHINSISVIY